MTAVIPKLMDEHSGQSFSKEYGVSTLREMLEGLVDDVSAAHPAVIASADATDLASVLTLANEMKAALNTAGALTASVSKE